MNKYKSIKINRYVEEMYQYEFLTLSGNKYLFNSSENVERLVSINNFAFDDGSVVPKTAIEKIKQIKIIAKRQCAALCTGNGNDGLWGNIKLLGTWRSKWKEVENETT